MTSKFAKKSTSSNLNETWYDVRGRSDIHGNMTFKVIQGQGQGEEVTSVPYRDYFLFNKLIIQLRHAMKRDRQTVMLIVNDSKSDRH